ncbi:MAG: Fur family transcriptional regulator [Candidatus Binatia bacterium]
MRKRTTQQLRAVCEALQEDHSHPSAEEIYRRVQQVFPRISLGTVYRNLQRLVAEGQIRAVRLGDRMTRYDPTLEDHDHFICQRCGRVEDVWLERDRQINLTPLIKKGFTIIDHSLAIHGVCRQCSRLRGRQVPTGRKHHSRSSDVTPPPPAERTAKMEDRQEALANNRQA